MAFITKDEKQIELQDITDSDIEVSYNFSAGNAHINRLALPEPASKMDVFTGGIKYGTIIGGAMDWASDRVTLPNSGSTDRKDIEARIRKESAGMNIPVEILGDIADKVYSEDNVVFALQDAQAEMEWKQDVASLGLTGTALEMGATLLDPVAWGSGAIAFKAAKATNTVARLISSSERVQNAVKYGLVGSAEAGAYVAGLNAMNYTYTSEDVVYSAIAGGTLLGFLGTLGKQANKVQAELLEVEDTKLYEKVNKPAPKKTVKKKKSKKTKDNVEEPVSVFDDKRVVIKDTDGTFSAKKTLVNIESIVQTDPTFLENTYSKLQQRFNKSGASLYNQAMGTKNNVLNAVSHYTLSGSLKPGVWTASEVKDRGRSVILQHNTGEQWYRKARKVMPNLTREEFFDDVFKAVKGTQEPLDDFVAGALKDWEKLTKTSRDLAKELGHSLPEDITYIPHVLDGSKLRLLIQSGKKDTVVDLLSEMYIQGLNKLDKKTARKLARTSITRTIDSDLGLRASIQELMGSSGKEHLKGILQESKLSDKEINAIIKRLPEGSTKDLSSNTMANIAKAFDVEVNGLSVTDIVDTDVYKLGNRYAEEMSGALALKQIGVDTISDWNKLKQMAIEEEVSKGKDPNKVMNAFDDIRNGFMGRPTRGGVNKKARRVLDTTSLALYANLGWTSAIEFSNIVAQAGFMNTIKAIPELRSFLSEVRSGTVPESAITHMKYLTAVDIKPHLVTSRIRREIDAIGADDALEIKIDQNLAKAQEFLGVASGFYSVNSASRHVALNATIANILDKLGKKGDKDILFYGIDADLEQRIISELERHPPAYNHKGVVTDVRTYKWDAKTAWEFEMAVSRGANRAIQRSLVGESTPQFGSTLGAILGQTLSFPITAINKQLGYNIARGDTKAVMNLMTTTAFASFMYMNKVYLDSLSKEDPAEYREKRLTTNNVLWGGINYSPMLPFMGNIASFFNGVGLLPNEYSPESGRYTSGRGEIPVLSSLPSVSVLERIVKAPGKLLGDSSVDERASALKSIPLMNLPPLRAFIDLTASLFNKE